MVASLSCVANSDVSPDDYGQLFSQVCGYGADNCAGFDSHANNGSYGAWSMCNATEKLSYAFNQYYEAQNQDSSACDFGGSAATQAPQSAQGACASLISAAGTDGSGQITGVQATGISQASGGSGGGAAASSSTGAASSVSVPAFQWGLLSLAAYVTAAGAIGVSMVLL